LRTASSLRPVQAILNYSHICQQCVSCRMPRRQMPREPDARVLRMWDLLRCGVHRQIAVREPQPHIRVKAVRSRHRIADRHYETHVGRHLAPARRQGDGRDGHQHSGVWKRSRPAAGKRLLKAPELTFEWTGKGGCHTSHSLANTRWCISARRRVLPKVAGGDE